MSAPARRKEALSALLRRAETDQRHGASVVCLERSSRSDLSLTLRARRAMCVYRAFGSQR